MVGANTVIANSKIDEKKLIFIELNDCYIVGLQYYEGKDFDASTIDYLTLKREPENEFDENAIEVYYNQLKLGYIPKKENKIIAKIMDQKIQVVAKVTGYQADESYAHRIKVKLFQMA